MIEALRRFSMLCTSAIAALASLCFAPMQAWSQPSSGNVASAEVTKRLPAVVRGEVQNMVLKGDSIEVTYKNIGELPTVITGELQVHLTEDEIVSANVFADAISIKPGATQRFRIAMPKLAKGKYTMVAIVDYGGEEMTAAMATLDMR